MPKASAPVARGLLAAGLWLLLTACSVGVPQLPYPPSQPPAAQPRNQTSATPSATAPPVCRVGPSGGPPAQLADRGIGGTGGPMRATTVSAEGATLVDRGIGGTGIIGVITGFASICLAGQEVQYAPGLPVLMDGTPAASVDLRAGQVAALVAYGPATALRAGQIAVRHEVSGPVEQASPGRMLGGMDLLIAGQRVVVTAATLGDTDLQPGEWVMVSGLRDVQGVIQATRIDRTRQPDLAAGRPVRIHALVVREAGHWFAGPLEIRPGPAVFVIAGPAEITGHLKDGILFADSIVPDPWIAPGGGLALPAPLFGGLAAGIVGAALVESFAGYSKGHILLSRNGGAVAGGGFATPSGSTVKLSRRPDGGLTQIRPGPLAPATPGAGGPRDPEARPAAAGSRFEPAPMPNRDANPAGGNGAASGDNTRVGRATDGRPGARPPARAR